MKEILKTIGWKEWRLVLLIACILIVVTTLPYIYAYFGAPSGTVYNGIHVLTPGDLPVYFSYINQVKEGSFLNKDYFTSENQKTGMFNIVWFTVGFFARVFNLAPVFAFHLARLALIPTLLFVLYLFLAYIFEDKVLRKLSFFILSFVSGLGIYLAVPSALEQTDYYFHALDLWVAESNLFLTMYQTPHFILSHIMMISIFLFLLLAFEFNQTKYSIIAGILALIYFNFHPYYILTIFWVPSVFLLVLIFKKKKILWSKVKHLLIISLISFPSIFYHLYLIKKEPVIMIRATQNIVLIESFWAFLWGYGLLIPLSFLGIYLTFKAKKLNFKLLFVLTWLVASIILILLPTQFQSRYLEGLILPLVIFSAITLIYIYNFIKFKSASKLLNSVINNKILLFVLFILFLAPTNFFNLTKDFYYFTTNNPDVFYLPEKEVRAWQWLSNNAAREEVVIAELSNSLFIPAYSRQKVFVGHGHESLYYHSKKILNQLFYVYNTGDEKKKRFLKQNNINYVFYSDKERKLGEFQPDEKDYLEKIYQENDVAIYQFTPNP